MIERETMTLSSPAHPAIPRRHLWSIPVRPHHPASSLLLVALFAAGLSVGCSPARGGLDGEWRAERHIEGTVTTVRTISGSVWRGKARLVEETSIGPEHGPEDAYLFGNVEDLTADEERIYVLDESVPTVRIFDRQGNHLFDIGRRGSGPGELQAPRRIALEPGTGRLFVRDDPSSRINIYDRTGRPVDHWRLFSQGTTSLRMFFAPDGTLYTGSILNLGVPPDQWLKGLVSWGPQGVLGDTLAPPRYDFEPWVISALRADGWGGNYSRVPFAPDLEWNVSSDRVMVSGVSSDYRFEIRHLDGRVVIAERSRVRVPVQPAEAVWYERSAISNMRETQPGWAWNGPAIPHDKPAFQVLWPDLSGRVWVVRQGTGWEDPAGVEDPLEDPDRYHRRRWFDTLLLDVFDLDGRYLGEVEAPEGLCFSPEPHIRGEDVVAYHEGADGMPRIKRYRLVLP